MAGVLAYPHVLVLDVFMAGSETDEGEDSHNIGAGAERGAWVAETRPAVLKQLLGMWLKKCGVRACPLRADFRVPELKQWLSNIALIELVNEGLLFRVCGTSLIARLGREATGHHVHELAKDIGGPLEEAIGETLRSGLPLWRQSTVTLGRYERHYAELFLPLARQAEAPPSITLMASFPLKL